MDAATILLIAALICFVLDAFGASVRRVSLTPLGLALCVMAVLVPLL